MAIFHSSTRSNSAKLHTASLPHWHSLVSDRSSKLQCACGKVHLPNGACAAIAWRHSDHLLPSAKSIVLSSTRHIPVSLWAALLIGLRAFN
ncbi:unnamed protein product [Protopolystoma xenopodis]|uniref:Uncharacterized protein n=1 Tax=Protopolystoma xenopodis TaxID=117903 RepID=A0A448WN42_9PLAT|nr:unnamed protein product [Protopolystoma xenopodis]